MRTSSTGRWGEVAHSELDFVLTAQIALAWAGERCEDRRLGWWESDLTDEFGGVDLFQHLFPRTWRWSTLQGAREAAIRHDARLRERDHDPDRIVSLYRLGHEMDERLAERLSELKQRGLEPTAALPGLSEVISRPWATGSFAAWVGRHGKADYVNSPIGRRFKGEAPDGLEPLVRNLVAALAPLGEDYPLPHYRSGT